MAGVGTQPHLHVRVPGKSPPRPYPELAQPLRCLLPLFTEDGAELGDLLDGDLARLVLPAYRAAALLRVTPGRKFGAVIHAVEHHDEWIFAEADVMLI